MNTSLIPSPDMLGIPAKPLVVLLLLNLTLAAHWVFIGAAFGSTLVLQHNSLRGNRDETHATISRSILAFLPFTLSMGVTLGIAPLLFVQILYGNFFYSANVLISMWWLVIVPLVIANLYLFYLAKTILAAGKRLGAVLPGIMMAVFVLLAAILSSNMTLMQTPQAWESVWRFRGMALFLGDTVVLRLTFAIFGFLTIGGIWVAFMGKSGLIYDQEAGRRALDIGLNLANAAVVLQIIAGIGLVHALKSAPREASPSDAVTMVSLIIAAAALIATAFLLVPARKSGSWSSMSHAAVVYFAGLVAIAFLRDAVRQAAVSSYFQLSNAAVHPQWGPFTMFLVFLVIAIAAIVVLLKLATARSSP